MRAGRGSTESRGEVQQSSRTRHSLSSRKYVHPGINAEKTTVNKTGKDPCPRGVDIRVGEDHKVSR